MSRLSAIDLFCGVGAGGLSAGFLQEGYEVHLASTSMNRPWSCLGVTGYLG